MYSITDSGLPSELVLRTATSLSARRSGTSERSPSSLTVAWSAEPLDQRLVDRPVGALADDQHLQLGESGERCGRRPRSDVHRLRLPQEPDRRDDGSRRAAMPSSARTSRPEGGGSAAIPFGDEDGGPGA